MADKTTKPLLTLGTIRRQYATDEACKGLLKSLRWPEKVACPRCNASEKVYSMEKSKPFHWKCKSCNKDGYRFSVLTGTVFENTNVPLRTWFEVAFLMVSSKKGISALQVHRMIDPVRGAKGSYKTAWYMCHRLRAAMQEGGFFQLAGVVEIDEAYVGGDATNAHRGNRGKNTKATPGRRGNLVPPKVGVVGAIARKGNVVAKVIGSLDAPTIKSFVRRVVSDKTAMVATDGFETYSDLKSKFGMPHESVDHVHGEYVRGQVHTQTIESFWSLLKRGIMGSFHHVSAEHLPLYLNEFSFRHNHRHDPDIFRAVIAGC